MRCSICGADAWFVCGRSGRPICTEHARIEVVSRLSFGASDSFSVKPATSDDYPKIKELAEYFSVKTLRNSFGSQYDLLKLPAIVARTNSHDAGVLSYALEDDCLVIVMLGVLPGYQGLGVGRLLLESAIQRAASEGLHEIRVAISNDDLPAMYFYQKNGFRVYEVVSDEVANANGDVRVGFAGIPCCDEIHLRRTI